AVKLLLAPNINRRHNLELQEIAMQDKMIHLNTANTSVNSFETTETMLVGRTRSPRRGRRIAVLAACAVALAIAFPSHSFGQALVGAAASVNGQAITVPVNAAVPNATGSATAAAKIFHPPSSSYQVNGAAANATTEAPILDTIANLAQPIATNARNPIAQAPFITGTRNRITNCTVTDTVAGPNRPCRVVAGTGSFPLVNKGGNGISSDTGVVQRTVGNNNYEFATASASQRTLNNGMFRIIDNPATQVDAARGLPAPVAVAYTANHDPMAVYWNSPSNRSFTLDISQLQVNVSTTGPGAAASAFYAINAGVIDGTTDITLPEGSATPIFSLLLPFNDVDGQAPTINLAAFEIGAAGAISDSLGDVGLPNVAAGLLGDLTLVNGPIQFAVPYSLTVGVPGTSSQSVLFVDTQAFAESTAAPEPSTLMLLGSGLLGLAQIARKRRLLSRD
ncbi:MAG: PEP-CTERM sorting domain-containing protein, partial [Candidatus Korobacteraceae bacterium]